MGKIKYTILFVFTSLYTLGQQHYEHVTPLATNPVLVQIARQRALDKIGPPPPIIIKVLKLPFLDDFSKPSPFPDTSLWINGGAFTNYTYPICPHTLGIATLDGLNSAGQPYNPGASAYSSNPADTLTSQYIGLGTHSPIDSIYFSFYWQSGGLGSHPKTHDSLLVEFSNGTAWHEVWYHLGYIPADTDTNFHYVMIPITDPQYFVNGFQFRFRSYSCGAGNLDHWNIDEVYLNQNRSAADTFQHDVSFVYESPSLLNNYTYMPWEQFTAADAKSTTFIAEKNNDIVQKNTLFYDSIKGPTIGGYSGGSKNFPPFYDNGYNAYSFQAYPSVSFPYVALTGPATWNITYVMHSPPDFDMWNDTLRYSQVFSNYYAYDDGTAEANYSIIDFNSPTVALAYQIKLNHTDTLIGVNMFFNYVLANASSYTFRLAYWIDAGGQPGATPTYEDTAIYHPEYDSLDKFVYYKFSQPPTVSGTIYVGFIQTSGDSVNIGYDWNNNHQNQTFYNVEGAWYFSNLTGSMMMRPVFGTRNYNAVNEVKNSEINIGLYPNPARDEVQLSENMKPNTAVRIYGSDGRLWYENLHFSGNTISTAQLPQGFYILQIEPKDSKIQYKKLLISR